MIITALRKIKWFTIRRVNEIPAIIRHVKRKKVQVNNALFNAGKIRVAIICQYVPAWSKNKRIYETLKKDERFEVMLLCIPDRVSAGRLIDPNDLSNDVFDYFESHGYEESVNALLGNDKWFDLEQWHPDYVIYNRYDRPMPFPYKSSSVSNYSKVCFLEYGCTLLRMGEQMMDSSFAVNTSCFFADTEGEKEWFIQVNKLSCKFNLCTSVCCGISAVENIYNARNDIAEAWNYSLNSFRVIFTPRWTLDPAWGGSSFLKYEKFFLNMADSYPDMDILVRPHPLMFSNFVKLGIMTSEEVDAYKEACLAKPNMRVDVEKEYHSTFWKSSVLVTDYSSMIIEYFSTGKPIIFLAFSEKIEYTDTMLEMLKGCYIVSNEAELKQTICQLKNGYDPLEQIRLDICKRIILTEKNIHTSENIKKVLLERIRY